MTLRADPVPMPLKRVACQKKSNGSVYVYLKLRSYRNKHGTPTSEIVAIGKKDPVSGMLIPNRKYFELFPDESDHSRAGRHVDNEIGEHTVASCGAAYCLRGIARCTGLEKVLSECFPQQHNEILAASFYMVCEGNVMLYIDDWYDETGIKFARRMDDRQCSRLFASLGEGQCSRFFQMWVDRSKEHEYTAYDVTSISTYSTGIDIAEPGYNRDGDQLPQINLAMFYGAESQLPLYYEIYNGSVNDMARLKFTTACANKLGVSRTKFVFDRGFPSTDNMAYMHNEGYRYVTAMRGSLIETKKLIDACRADLRLSENRIVRSNEYAKSVQTDIYGFKNIAHVYWNVEKQAEDTNNMFECIQEHEARLKEANKSKRVPSSYSTYFDVTQTQAGAISYVLDNRKVDEHASRCGCFVLLTNDETLSSAEVLSLYRWRDEIEKHFNQFKNGLEFKRLHTHISSTTCGKMFVGFIALILRSYLLRRLRDSFPKKKRMTVEKAIRELSKIKVITFSDSTQLLTPITKLQRTILDALNLSVKDLRDSVK